jgi:hypothetical protein
MQDPIPKVSKTKVARGMVQVVEHLNSKHRTMTSNPSTAKKKIFKNWRVL